MKTFYQNHNVNSIADLSLFGKSNDHYIINRINVPESFRGKGYGSELLNKICEEADKEHVTLVLYISESGGLSEWQLRQWYERRGFSDRRLTGLFLRYPNRHKTKPLAKVEENMLK